jgi:chromate reductase
MRKGSYNKALMRVVFGLIPEDAKIEIFDREGIPPFNQDLERQSPQIARDWASRSYRDNAFKGKHVALMSAYVNSLGGARIQYHLRQPLFF